MILGALWLKRQGFGRVDHHRPISKEDLEKTSVLLQSILSRSKSLKQVVWFNLMFHLVHLIHRGRKTLLPLTKPCRLMQLVRSTYIPTSFPGFSPSRPTERWASRRQPWERGCVYQALDELDKNHRGKYQPDDSPGEGRMYERPKSPYCPVKTFELYLSQLNPSLSCLWQRPRARESFSERDEVWYCNAPLGKKYTSYVNEFHCEENAIVLSVHQ